MGEGASWNEQAPSRVRLGTLWRDRLKTAKERYDAAAATSQAAIKTFQEQALPPPDGGANLISALKAERISRSEYLRILRLYTDLLLSGKTPGE